MNEPVNREVGKYNLTPIEAMVINMHLPFGTKLELAKELQLERLPKMRYRKSKFKPINHKTRLKTLKYEGKPLLSPQIIIFTKSLAAYKKISNNYYAQDFRISYNQSTPSLSLIEQKLCKKDFTSFHDFKRAIRQLWQFYYINYEKRQDVIQTVGIMSRFSEEIFDEIDRLNEDQLMHYIKEDPSNINQMNICLNPNINNLLNNNYANNNNNANNNNSNSNNNTFYNHFTSNSSNNDNINNNNNGYKINYSNDPLNINSNINKNPIHSDINKHNLKPINPNTSKIVIYKEWSLEDKYTLNEKVNRLSQEQLLGIIPLLDDHGCADADYFEFDIKTLNAVQLNKLKKYVNDCLEEEQKSSIAMKSYPNEDLLPKMSTEEINKQLQIQHHRKQMHLQNETSLLRNNANITVDEYNKALSDSGSFDMH